MQSSPSSALVVQVRYDMSGERNQTNVVEAEIRQKAVEVAIALTAGAYQTSLVSYFTHRDLFPSLMTVGHSL